MIALGLHSELTVSSVNADISTVETDDITDLANDGEILEFVCEDHNLSPVVISWFAAL